MNGARSYDQMIVVSVEDRNYRLDQPLSLVDPLVMARRADIIANIQVDKLANNLGLLTDLVDLAYNAMPEREGQLRADIGQLQFDYGDLCQRCSLAMNETKAAAHSIGQVLPEAFGNLFNGDEDLAVGDLADCAAVATKLAASMGALALEFDRLADGADRAVRTSELRRGEEIQAKETLERANQEWVAKKDRAEKLRGELSTLIADLQVRYDDGERKLEKTEDRAFALALTGAIMKPLGEGLGGAATAVALIYSGPPRGSAGDPRTTGGAQPAPTAGAERPDAPAVVPDKTKQEYKAAEQKHEASKLSLAVAEADAEMLEAEIVVIDEEIPEAPAKEKETLRNEKAERQRDLDVVNGVKEQLGKTTETAKRELDAAKAAIEALGTSVAGAGAALSQMGHDYLEIAEAQREQLQRLFDIIMEKKDIERETLADIAEATTRMANISTNIKSSEVTISALFQVIAALRKVADILHDARAFWECMAKACEDLAAPDFQRSLERRMAKDGEPMDRVRRYYDSAALKLRLLNYMAGWGALELVAEEYREHTDNLYQEARAKRSTTLPHAEAQERVKKLSAELLAGVKADRDRIEAEKEELAKAFKEAA